MKFDRYFLYEEMQEWLRDVSERHPDLLSQESIGESYEGRQVYAVTVTDRSCGRPEHKPALYVDGNIHAGEVTASMTCLYLIDYLVSRGAEDRRVKKLLENRTFYIIPRANPDGAEKYLTTPETLRSSVRTYPEHRKDVDPPGLCAEDIDDDGEILLMRIQDDVRGAWKADSEDPRLMVERCPTDLEGPFYHIYSEGLIRDDRGEVAEEVELPFRPVPTRYGLDLNRNFPAGYLPTAKGSGPYPLSEPETRNLVEFIDAHPNIGGALIYHTTGGVLFRPHSTIPDEQFDKEDMALYETIGRWGTETSGYPVVCCYGDIWSGVLDDWCWEHRGIFAFTPELWDLVGRAAPETKKDPTALRSLPPDKRRELELKLLKYNDRQLFGRGFEPWRTFKHPQLGTVEIGGWRPKECRQNPPRHLLAAECHRNIGFALVFALGLPEVHVDELGIRQMEGRGDYLISALVSNHGYLDTRISKQAEKQQAVRQDLVELVLPGDAVLVSGDRITEVGYLEGYARSHGQRSYRVEKVAESSRRLKWTVHCPSGGEIAVIIKSQRGGTDERRVSISPNPG